MKFKKYGYAAALLLCYSMNGNCMKPIDSGSYDSLLRKMEDDQNKITSNVILQSIRLNRIDGACNMLDELNGQLFLTCSDLRTVFGCEQARELIHMLYIFDCGGVTPQILENILAKIPNLRYIALPVGSSISSTLFEKGETLNAEWICYTPVQKKESQDREERSHCQVS
ncbi:MAG: hypothetical protein LBE95_00805 [Holosporaceae bacterium]|nr:hypothetical protein [Holosporaceae bacterium]